ncbi:hypothetical protein HYS47_02145 [Candidatus Woesearchaeota archaeon]|nr:hypothetical protein [Candidatus Woesearchaeota archaeon]
MSIPTIAPELARRIYPDGKPKDLVEVMAHAAVITGVVLNRPSDADAFAMARDGLLDLRTQQGPRVTEYLQWAHVPREATREVVVRHIGDVLERHGFYSIDDSLFRPITLYEGDGRIIGVHVSTFPAWGYLYVTVSDVTDVYTAVHNREVSPASQ